MADLANATTLKNSLQSITENIQKTDADYDNRSVCLFFSFDLQGSTELKNNEEKKWIDLIKFFYKKLTEKAEKEIPGIKIWKLVGDEVLFFLDLKETKIIYSNGIAKILETVHNIQNSITNQLITFCEEKEISNYTPGIKPTVWIAGVITNDGSSQEYPFSNVQQELKKLTPHTDDVCGVDFLGTEIDAGFRIAHLAQSNKVSISADLAYILEDKANREVKDKIKIIDFQELKGVWAKKPYPIIWYHPDWDSYLKNLKYYEKKENELIGKLLVNENSNSRLKDDIYKIFKDTGREEGIKSLIELLNLIYEKNKKKKSKTAKDIFVENNA